MKSDRRPAPPSALAITAATLLLGLLGAPLTAHADRAPAPSSAPLQAPVAPSRPTAPSVVATPGLLQAPAPVPIGPANPPVAGAPSVAPAVPVGAAPQPAAAGASAAAGTAAPATATGTTAAGAAGAALPAAAPSNGASAPVGLAGTAGEAPGAQPLAPMPVEHRPEQVVGGTQEGANAPPPGAPNDPAAERSMAFGTGAGQCRDTVPGGTMLAIAYAVVLAVLGAYAFVLARKNARLAAALDELEGEISRRRPAGAASTTDESERS